ncbi:MAG: Gfo/Idh/MocA family oxidoreductase [Armatimonadetes bacterium]|nr:Gfo/Idh/MocA family oxidoreductase [Armatimonadota bacterium]
MSETKMSRRDFLKQSAIGAAALGLSAYGAPAMGSVIGANDRIRIGVIGCGGMGTGHLQRLVEMSRNPDEKLQVVAVCDVYEPRKDRAKTISRGRLFHDYRKMLEMPDLDAVLVATPDHWHAKMSIDAMEAGKDVYVEKPMTLHWKEAKEVAAVQAKTARVLQVGVQSTSEDRWWRANELLKQGAIGKLLWTQSSICRNSREGEWNWGIDPDARPGANLDWNLWLGPARKRKWDPERYFRFRKFWDYSGGIATDLFYHQLGHLQIALGPEFPQKVSASGGIYAFRDREVPDTFHIMIDYPSGHTVAMVSSMANRQGIGEVIYGHEATMHFESPGVVIRPEEEFQNERREVRVPEQPRSDHMHNFLECIRSRQDPHCNARTGYRIMTAISLSVEAYRKGKIMKFDPAKEEVIK